MTKNQQNKKTTENLHSSKLLFIGQFLCFVYINSAMFAYYIWIIISTSWVLCLSFMHHK